MEERYTTFSLLLVQISRCVQRIKNVEMAALGLKGRQVQCLFALNGCPEGASLTQLAELCGEDKGAVSRTVKELLSKGLVYVDAARGRRYKNPIRLTGEGGSVAGVVAGRVSAMLDEGSAGISDAERIQLYRTLGIISDNLTHICKQYAP